MQPTEKGDADDNGSVRQANTEDENGREDRVDAGDDDLRAEDSLKTVVEIMEARRDFGHARRIEIICVLCGRAHTLMAPTAKEQARSHDDSDHNQHEKRARSAGDMRHVADIMAFT